MCEVLEIIRQVWRTLSVKMKFLYSQARFIYLAVVNILQIVSCSNALQNIVVCCFFLIMTRLIKPPGTKRYGNIGIRAISVFGQYRYSGNIGIRAISVFGQYRYSGDIGIRRFGQIPQN